MLSNFLTTNALGKKEEGNPSTSVGQGSRRSTLHGLVQKMIREDIFILSDCIRIQFFFKYSSSTRFPTIKNMNHIWTLFSVPRMYEIKPILQSDKIYTSATVIDHDCDPLWWKDPFEGKSMELGQRCKGTSRFHLVSSFFEAQKYPKPLRISRVVVVIRRENTILLFIREGLSSQRLTTISGHSPFLDNFPKVVASDILYIQIILSTHSISGI